MPTGVFRTEIFGQEYSRPPRGDLPWWIVPVGANFAVPFWQTSSLPFFSSVKNVCEHWVTIGFGWIYDWLRKICNFFSKPITKRRNPFLNANNSRHSSENCSNFQRSSCNTSSYCLPVVPDRLARLLCQDFLEHPGINISYCRYFGVQYRCICLRVMPYFHQPNTANTNIQRCYTWKHRFTNYKISLYICNHFTRFLNDIHCN